MAKPCWCKDETCKANNLSVQGVSPTWSGFSADWWLSNRGVSSVAMQGGAAIASMHLNHTSHAGSLPLSPPRAADSASRPASLVNYSITQFPSSLASNDFPVCTFFAGLPHNSPLHLRDRHPHHNHDSQAITDCAPGMCNRRPRPARGPHGVDALLLPFPRRCWHNIALPYAALR